MNEHLLMHIIVQSHYLFIYLVLRFKRSQREPLAIEYDGNGPAGVEVTDRRDRASGSGCSDLDHITRSLGSHSRDPLPATLVKELERGGPAVFLCNRADRGLQDKPLSANRLVRVSDGVSVCPRLFAAYHLRPLVVRDAGVTVAQVAHRMAEAVSYRLLDPRVLVVIWRVNVPKIRRVGKATQHKCKGECEVNAFLCLFVYAT